MAADDHDKLLAAMISRPAVVAVGQIAREVASVRTSLERLDALLDIQDQRLVSFDRQRLPLTAGAAAAQRLRAMKQAGI